MWEWVKEVGWSPKNPLPMEWKDHEDAFDDADAGKVVADSQRVYGRFYGTGN